MAARTAAELAGEIADIVGERTPANVPYYAQMAALASELELDAEGMETLFTTIDSTSITQDVGYLTALSEVTRYEGFNPRFMAGLMIKAHRVARDNAARNPEMVDKATATLMVDDREVQFIFTGNEPFLRDLQFLCCTFINKGAVIDKISKKSKAAFSLYI